MHNDNTVINLLFASTPDYLPFALITALSVADNTNSKIRVHFFYADIVNPITEEEKSLIFENIKFTLKKNNIESIFYDVKEKMSVFEEQNFGMWGKEVSMTHYMYLLAPDILKDCDTIIYLDTDMIVNCDLSSVANMNFENKLLAMGAPRGFEEMGEDVSNSGFVVLNLLQWRKEDTLKNLLKFGQKLPKSNFCDQNLLHEFFTKNNPEKLIQLDKNYNIFPQLFSEIPLENIKIFHYTGISHTKPWNDMELKQRGGFLWWKYARETPFYEKFLFKNYLKPISICTEQMTKKQHKVYNFFGFKIKIRRK